MIHVNEILVYSRVPERYYTDGEYVFIEVKKERFAKFHRISLNGKRFKVKSQRDCPPNYLFIQNRLFRKMTWQFDKKGYHFVLVGGRNLHIKISRHRLVYFYWNNIIPPSGMVVDHINRNKQCNELSNLRLVSCKENANNINIDQHSKRMYRITNIKDGQTYMGKPYVIANILGVDSGSLNRYAKKNFLYRHIWRVEVLKEDDNEQSG